jgi:hypothetical protein
MELTGVWFQGPPPTVALLGVHAEYVRERPAIGGGVGDSIKLHLY